MEHAVMPPSATDAPRPSMARTITRWTATTIHLSISTAIGLSVVAVMLFLWYPGPYFKALAGGTLVLTLIGVDVVIGPLLTCIVFKPGKKRLRFDLAVIALLQLGALFYGVHVVYEARPVFVVFTVDRFNVIAANEIDPAEQAKVTRPEFKSLSLSGPRLVAADFPEDSAERERILFAAVGTAGGYDLQNFPQHYVPYGERRDRVLARAKPLVELRQQRPGAEASFASLLNGGRSQDSLVFLPLLTSKVDWTAVIDKATADVIDVLPVDPWIKS